MSIWRNAKIGSSHSRSCAPIHHPFNSVFEFNSNKNGVLNIKKKKWTVYTPIHFSSFTNKVFYGKPLLVFAFVKTKTEFQDHLFLNLCGGQIQDLKNINLKPSCSFDRDENQQFTIEKIVGKWTVNGKMECLC